MADEQQRQLIMSRSRVNWLTSLMPTMEGLFLATVLDGKEGRVIIRYHASVAQEVDAFIDDMCSRYPNEIKTS